MGINALKDLDAWRVAIDFAVDVYQSSKAFPRDEIFGLRIQLRRAAVSIASNIAEGHGRATRPDYARFVKYARGSLKECETHIVLSSRLGYIDPPTFHRLDEQMDRINRLISGLHRSLVPKGKSHGGAPPDRPE